MTLVPVVITHDPCYLSQVVVDGVDDVDEISEVLAPGGRATPNPPHLPLVHVHRHAADVAAGACVDLQTHTPRGPY